MKVEWNKVTWYSKLGALIVLAIVVFLGFYFWSEYQKIQDLNNSASVGTLLERETGSHGAPREHFHLKVFFAILKKSIDNE